MSTTTENAQATVPQPQGFAEQKTNGKAVASMVTGIASLVVPFVGIVTGPVSLVLSHKAKKEIRRAAGAQSGSGFAVTGLVTSIIALVGYAVFIGMLATGAMFGAAADASAKADDANAASSIANVRTPGGGDWTSADWAKGFQAYVSKHGTTQEKAAVSHVTKIQGLEGNGDRWSSQGYSGVTLVTDLKSQFGDMDKGTVIGNAWKDYRQSSGGGTTFEVETATGSYLESGEF